MEVLNPIEVLNSDVRIASIARPSTKGATLTRRVGIGAPKILVAVRRTSKIKGGILVKGRTTGVVVGETVDLLITDISGKGLSLISKIGGDGKFRACTHLNPLVNGTLKLTATTTSLDGASLSTESYWAIDLPPGVSNISPLDERYKRFHFVQVINHSQEYPDLPMQIDKVLNLDDASQDTRFLDTKMTPDDGHEGEVPAPVGFKWSDGTSRPTTEDGIYSISSKGLITIPPSVKP
jgi:hypothetical protein